MVHFDGKHWRTVERVTDADLTGIHGPDANDIWAVGENVVLHWDGNAWSIALEDQTLIQVRSR